MLALFSGKTSGGAQGIHTVSWGLNLMSLMQCTHPSNSNHSPVSLPIHDLISEQDFSETQRIRE